MEELLRQPAIHITNITNPFDPMHSREFKTLPTGFSLKQCIDLVRDPMDGCYYVAAVNGEVVPENADYSLIYPTGSVVLCAQPKGGGGKGGKNILRTVLEVIVVVIAAVATWYVGGAGGWGTAAAIFGVEAGGWAAMAIGSVVGVAIATAGNLLINALMPYDYGDSTGSESENSSTYSWAPDSNANREGVVWPVLYGITRIVPPIIGKYIETVGDIQYLNILYALADHPIDYFDAASVKLNDNFVTYGVDGVYWDARWGTLNQTVLWNFRDSRTTKAIGSKLTSSWTTVDADGTLISGLSVAISLPYGLFQTWLEGMTVALGVTIYISYKREQDSAWTEYGYYVSDAKTSSKRLVYTFNHIPEGQYQVRARAVADTIYIQGKADVYLEFIESIIYDDFTYPGSSLFAIRVQATEKLSGGMPSLSLVAGRTTVPVHNGTQYVNLPANNPAWASYDALHDSNYGGGVPYNKIIYADFLAWANNCILHYKSPGVASAVRFQCNYYVDSSMTLRKLLNNIGQCGRGSVVQIGSEYTCFVDKLETTPAQSFIFNMGNIEAKSFSIEYMDVEERANALDVTFWNKDNDYKQQTIEVHATDFDSTTMDVKKTQITLYACTSRAEALAHAYFALNNTRLLTTTCSFSADIDAIGCFPWDVVEVQHDVTLWGDGGRLVSAESDQVVLDKEITLAPDKTYTLRIQHSADDQIKTYTVVAVLEETTTSIITITSTFDPLPEALDKWIITETDKATKQFRLIKTMRKSNLGRTLACLEYNPDVYVDDGTLEEPEAPSLPLYEYALRAVEVIPENGSMDASIHLTWMGYAPLWRVFYQYPGQTDYVYAGETQTPFFRIPYLDANANAYTFCVSHTRRPSDGITTTLVVQGGAVIDPPATPANFTAAIRGQVIVLQWTKATDVSVYGYTITLNGTNIVEEFGGNMFIYSETLSAGVYNFTLMAVNKGGESDPTDAVSLTILIPATPSPSAVIEGEYVVVTWSDCATTLPIAYYTVNGAKHGTATRYLDRITWIGERVYSIIAYDTCGNASTVGQTSVTITGLTTPTGIVAIGGCFLNKLTITFETFQDFECVEVWASTTNNRANASKVGETPISTWTHGNLDLITTLYYWVRTRNIYGTTGDWYPSSATAGVECTTSDNPADYLTILENSITTKQLTEELASTIAVMLDSSEVPIYSATDPYIIGDHVRYYSSGAWRLYTCIQAGTGHAPTEIDYWEVDEALLSKMATVEESFGAIISDIGTIQSKYVLKLNANNHIVGFALMVDEEGSSAFVVTAETFQVCNNANDVTPVPIFTVGNINGVNGVGISGNVIIDGSILARNLKLTENLITVGAQIKNAIIENAHIKDATIETGKIKDLQVTNAKIADATIETAKIKDLAVTNAKIGLLAVKTGNIADLNVDTLKIAGNAVTIPVGTYATGLVTVNPETWATVLSITIASSGAPITIFCQAAWWPMSTGGLIGLAHNGSYVQYRDDEPTSGPSKELNFIFTHTPGKGNQTYSIIVYGGTPGGYFSGVAVRNRSLFAIECKR
jgi:predicted phage tail protein